MSAPNRAGKFDVVCDLGGTNVRFACIDESGALTAIEARPLREFSAFTDALASYLEANGAGARPQRVAIGAAGPVGPEGVQLTNAPWFLAKSEVAAMTDTGRVCLVNDLEAVARAVPVLTPDDVAALNGLARIDMYAGAPPAIVINVGTGLGAASIRRVRVAAQDRWLTGATESGHMSLSWPAPEDLIARTLEDVLSGPGLTRCATALGAGAAEFADTAAVFDKADSVPAAAAALKLFGNLLGRACRDLILAHGAWSGVYLVGSVVDAWSARKNLTAFQDGFALAGPMQQRLSGVPVHRITRPLSGLAGLSEFLKDERRPA